MWEFIQESVMLKNIYYLECRNRLKNPRYQNKSIKRTDYAITTSKCLKHLLDGFETSMHKCKGKEKTIH